MKPDPATRLTSNRSPGHGRRAEGEGSENKEVIVVEPAHCGQDRHGGEDHRKTPVVQGTESRVPAWTFGTEHRDEPRGHGADASKDVHRDYG
jgi:hypothetical protein